MPETGVSSWLRTRSVRGVSPHVPGRWRRGRGLPWRGACDDRDLIALTVHALHVAHVVAALRGRVSALRRLDLLRRPLAAEGIVGLKLLERLPGPRKHHHARASGR